MNRSKDQLCGTCLFNGQLIDEAELRFTPFERGVLYGDGCFESIRVYYGVPFKLGEHLERLKQSCFVCQFPMPVSNTDFAHEVRLLLSPYQKTNGYLRISLFRGHSNGVFDISSTQTQRLIQFQENEIENRPPGKVQFVYQNLPPKFPIAPKTTSYLFNILCRHQSQKEGYDESVFLGPHGEVCEGASSNIFLVKGKRIQTPTLKLGVLNGITRSLVMQIALRAQFEVEEKVLFPVDFYHADEVFLTNSLCEIWPILQVDKESIADGKIGEITQFLQAEYRKTVDQEALHS